MRKALALSLLAMFLGGCASDPADRDISGIWINQVAIDAAAKGGPCAKRFRPMARIWNGTSTPRPVRPATPTVSRTSKDNCWANSPAPGKSTFMAAPPAN